VINLIPQNPTGSLVYRYESLTENQPANKTEAPDVINVEEEDEQPVVDDADDNHSNLSQSLLSIDDSNDHVDEYYSSSFVVMDNEPGGAEEHYSVPTREIPTTSLKDGHPGKRKTHYETTDIDQQQQLDGQKENKRKKRSLDEDVHAKDKESKEEDDEEVVALDSGSSSSAEELVSSDDDISPEKTIEKCKDLKKMKYKYLKLFKKLKMTQADMLTLKMENTIEKEEYLQRQNDVKSKTEAYKEELYKKVLEVMEQEFACCVCNEIFVIPTVVDCGHTFCDFCISEWARKKPACPICRKNIRNQTKHVEMDNYICKLYTLLSPEIRMKRDSIVAERVIEKDQAALKATAEARGRRGGFPNPDFGGFHPPGNGGDGLPSALDLLEELQFDHQAAAAMITANAAAVQRSNYIYDYNFD
jgi:hypothetical protein